MQEREIIEYLRGTAPIEKQKQLEQWIRDSEENLIKFNEVKALYVVATFENTSSVIDTDKAYKKFLRRTKQSSLHRFHPIYKYVAAAALVLLLVGLPMLLNTETENYADKPIIVNNQIEPGTNDVILTLDNGEQLILDKAQEVRTANATSNGKEISYSKNSSSELAYNHLTVPRGGHFQLSLSDGTKVWLNSETQLKYPVNFVQGESRQVELVYGEAYFDVTPHTQHNGSKFIVVNNAQRVQVLGTEFNIKSYKGDTVIYTTLVEGEVTIITPSQNQILKPNQQSAVTSGQDDIEVADINVRGEIAWINGEFILQNKTLKEIMITLSRWYDMEVVFANKELEQEKFVGILRKEQNIVDILNTIKRFNIIKTYEINNKQVILK